MPGFADCQPGRVLMRAAPGGQRALRACAAGGLSGRPVFCRTAAQEHRPRAVLSLDWLHARLAAHPGLAGGRCSAPLLQLTVSSAAQAIARHAPATRALYVRWWRAEPLLMAELAAALPHCRVSATTHWACRPAGGKHWPLPGWRSGLCSACRVICPPSPARQAGGAGGAVSGLIAADEGFSRWGHTITAAGDAAIRLGWQQQNHRHLSPPANASKMTCYFSRCRAGTMPTFQEIILPLAELLERARLRVAATLRHGNGRRHLPYRHLPAGAGPGAVARRLCAAFAPPKDGRYGETPTACNTITSIRWC